MRQYKSTTEKIPDELLPIIEKVKSELSLEHTPNQVLINHFPPFNRLYPNSTHLAMHSDDEESIVPNSDIVTISVGGPRTLIFHFSAKAKLKDGICGTNCTVQFCVHHVKDISKLVPPWSFTAS